MCGASLMNVIDCLVCNKMLCVLNLNCNWSVKKWNEHTICNRKKYWGLIYDFINVINKQIFINLIFHQINLWDCDLMI